MVETYSILISVPWPVALLLVSASVALLASAYKNIVFANINL